MLTLRLTPRTRGGKGGFGSQLRAAGGRMSSQKTSNRDSCRDLNGRRLSTVKEAKALVSYLESEPERKKAQQEAQRAKLEALERKLGISGGVGKDGEAGPSTGPKRRFDDTEYLEQSQEIVENVKNAVLSGILKKKKRKNTAGTDKEKVKAPATSTSEQSLPTTTPQTELAGETLKDVATVVDAATETPATAPVAPPVAAPLAAVGA